MTRFKLRSEQLSSVVLGFELATFHELEENLYIWPTTAHISHMKGHKIRDKLLFIKYIIWYISQHLNSQIWLVRRCLITVPAVVPQAQGRYHHKVDYLPNVFFLTRCMLNRRVPYPLAVWISNKIFLSLLWFSFITL